MMNEELMAKVAPLGCDVNLIDGRPYLSEWVPECGEDPRANVEARCREIQEELAEIGLTLEDLYLDHDTVAGYIIEKAQGA